MTSHRYKRCVHCGIVYAWQSSGYGCNKAVNDAKYCPECKAAINEALKKVPIRIVSVWEDTDKVTVEFLLNQRKLAREEARKNHPNRIIGERVLAPLFDMVDPENKNANYVIKWGGDTYAVETWSKEPERNKVMILMEENLLTGKRRPWRDV